MRANKKPPLKSDKTQNIRGHKRGVVGYSRKTALLEEAITQMNAGKYGRSSAALKELLALDPHNMEARRLFATLHLRLGSLIPARQAFDSLINEAFQRQDYWLAESLLREYLAAGPRCVPFLEKLGALYQEKGNMLEAVAEYGKAIDILIEDPDPDNPHHASQLYAKIRELAPASPVAFRFTSFFDVQTGELLARQSNDSGQSTVAPSSDMSEGSQGMQAGLEPMDGVMPWEIQDSQETAPDVFKVTDVPNSSEALIPPVIMDLPAHQGPTLDEEMVHSNPPLREQTSGNASEGKSDAQDKTCIHEFESAPSEAGMKDLSGQVDLEGTYSLTPSMPVAESSETQHGLDPTVSTGCPGTPQDQERLLDEAEPEASYDISGSSTTSAHKEPAGASEPPISSAQPIEAAGIMPSSQIEEMSAPVFLGTEPSAAGSIEAEDRQFSLQQPVETNSMEVVAEPPSDTPIPSNPEAVSANKISEPWKHPGFSWESLFNSAWNFGSDHSANVPSSEVTRTNIEEEALTSASAASLQEVLEDQALEIPAREESTSLGEQVSSGYQIVPMPWDQVQGSVISILPLETDQPVSENTESMVDRSAGEADSGCVLNVSEDQAQPPISQINSVVETEVFLIASALQTPVSAEPETSAVGLGQFSFPTESSPAFVESEPQLPAVSSLTMDEAPPLETPVIVTVPPLLEHGSVPVDIVVPLEVSSKSADSVLSEDNDRAIATARSAVQKLPVTPSQPTGETQHDETEILLSSPLLEHQKSWESPPAIGITSPLAEEMTEVQIHEQQQPAMAFVEAQFPIPEPVPKVAPEQEEWVKAGEAARSIEQPPAALVAQVPPAILERMEVSRPMSEAPVVDVLFESSRNVRTTESRQPVVESKLCRKTNSTLSRVRIAIADFASSCFSTSRSIVVTCVGLVMLSGFLMALGIGAIGLTWVIMEESSSPVFQSLTTIPQRTLTDFKKNGYFFLLGIDAPVGLDPIQAGHDRKLDTNGGSSALVCFGGSGSRTIEGSNASTNVMRGWVRSPDPIGEFKSHQETIKGWRSQHEQALSRYGQWQKLPFEDWGYGQSVELPCAEMVFAHQLHVADGFLQGADLGIDRLETDMEVWRIVLGQAKTLTIKMLAAQAINDDIAVASGLLVRSDFDAKYLGRVTKLLRPLDHVELSMRWPMQSELVSALKTYETQLKAIRAEEQPVYIMVASVMPLPMQRRLNDYAEYYDASYKAAGEGQYGSLPKRRNYIHFPAAGLMDYLTNPIENIVGLEPLAPWDLYNGFVVDTDAHLRLASLQAWLRRGSLDGNLLTRIAKAGQGFYDPYTGLPMLVNMKKGVLYSVGHDGKDQDGNPQLDVVVEIPAAYTSSSSTNRSAASSKS